MPLRFVIPGIPSKLRILLFAVLSCGGLYIQLFITGSFLPGGLLIIIASLFLLIRNYRNKPVDLGFEDWQPASLTEFSRIRQNFTDTKEIKFPIWYRRGFGIFLFVLCLVLTGLFSLFGEPYLPILTLNIAVISFPVFIAGAIRLWAPGTLKMKIDTFEPLVTAVERLGDEFVLTPYLRLDKDKEGRQIPEDVRFMLELKRNPEDFTGVQIQIAINNGPNGAVPYMYAVLLCKADGSVFTLLNSIRYGSFIKETGRDGDYRYIILRQNTENGGYHTREGDCMRLLKTVVQVMKKL